MQDQSNISDPESLPNPGRSGELSSPDADTSAVLPAPTEGSGSLQATQTAWTKVCSKCSVQATVSGDYCPNCGSAYGSRKRFKPSKKVILLTAAVIVLGAAGTVTVLSVQNAQAVAAEEEADRKSRAAAAAAAKEEARLQEEAEAQDTAERAIRGVIVTGLEEAVQKDAEKRVGEGRLDGPIQRTECTPLGGGSMDDLTAITGTFECIAVNEKRDDGSESGYVFSATVNWDSASYSWHLGR